MSKQRDRQPATAVEHARAESRRDDLITSFAVAIAGNFPTATSTPDWQLEKQAKLIARAATMYADELLAVLGQGEKEHAGG